jgi:hypothetical protein
MEASGYTWELAQMAAGNSGGLRDARDRDGRACKPNTLDLRDCHGGLPICSTPSEQRMSCCVLVLCSRAPFPRDMFRFCLPNRCFRICSVSNTLCATMHSGWSKSRSPRSFVSTYKKQARTAVLFMDETLVAHSCIVKCLSICSYAKVATTESLGVRVQRRSGAYIRRRSCQRLWALFRVGLVPEGSR